MAFEFLKELMEMELQQQAAPTVDQLVNTKEFAAIQQAAPDYAKNLQNAWAGDVLHHAQGSTDPFLAPGMMSTKYVAKFIPMFNERPAYRQALNDLIRLHTKLFAPTQKQRVPTDQSVWSQEKWAKESAKLNFDIKKYKVLCEELKETVNEE